MTSADSEDKNIIDVIYGAQQRRLREHVGVAQSDLAQRAGYSPDLIRKIERGQRHAQPEYIGKVDSVLGLNGLLIAAAEELAKLKIFPEWFAEFVEAEAGARRLDEYDVFVVPGILQTEEYARAVLSAHYPTLDDDEVEARVRARMERQALLTRKPTCMLSFIIEESVLRRPVGGKSTMKKQLHQLAECARMRNITIQVMPT